MSISLKQIMEPLRNLTECIGIVCNGEIEVTSNLKERLQNCRAIIGVDGGLNHCKKMNINPQWIVGDFDSIDPVLLEEFKKRPDFAVLPRAKDYTDLEAAIKKAKEISKYAQIVIWGGLGGRIDHTLNNIFLLFRQPACLFLESEQQMLFAVSAVNGEVIIDHSTHKTLALVPVNGLATNVSITSQKGVINVPFVGKGKPFIFPFNGTCKVNVEDGDVLVILDQRKFLSLDILSQVDIPMKFSLDQPVLQIFAYLMHQSLHFRTVKLYSDKESIRNLQQDSGKVFFPSKRGQTISLIPFYGPVTGIQTEGLKWELGEKTLDKLDKDFIGITNISMGDVYSIAVGQGELLCVINEKLIDLELAEAKITE